MRRAASRVFFKDLSGNQASREARPTIRFVDEGGIRNANYTLNGQWVETVSLNGTIKRWQVEDLDQALQRGCKWLQDSLKTHPEVKKELTVCNNKQL